MNYWNKSFTKDQLQNNQFSHDHWIFSILIGCVTIATLIFRYAMPLRDGDIWFHLAYGKYLILNKTLIPDHTAFSWTPSNNNEIYCTWLSDVFLYLVHQTIGINGLFLLRYLFMATIIIGCYYFSRLLNIQRNPLVWFCCLISILMSYAAAFIKPEIFSFALMTFFCWNWWTIRSGKSNSVVLCYLFPLLMLVWVNSHGGFIFGVCFLAAISLGEFLNTWLSKNNILSQKVRKHLFFAMMFSCLSIFITPYGYHYPMQLIVNFIPNQENYDFTSKVLAYQSPFSVNQDFQRFQLYLNLAILLLLVLISRNFRKIEWSMLLSNLIFAILYTMFIRTTFYLAPIFLFSALHQLSLPSFFFRKKSFYFIKYKILPTTILFSSLILSGDALKKSLTTPEINQWMGFGLNTFAPAEEVDIISKYFPNVRIGNSYEQGAYLIWKLWPSNKVFFDARHFPYKSWSNEYFQFSWGKNVYQMLSKYPSDVWLISYAYPQLISTLLDSNNWKMVFIGQSSLIIARSDIDIPIVIPKVSQKLGDIKNLSSGVMIFAVLCNIKDFSTAKLFLNSLKMNFKWKENLITISHLEAYLDGIIAYHNGEYEKALFFLLKAHPNTIVSSSFITNCYLVLCSQAWSSGNVDVAINYAQRAWNISGGNIYSAYNLSVIEWYKWRVSNSSRIGNMGHSTDWYIRLNHFLRISENNEFLIKEISISKNILAGTYEGKPNLIVPKSVLLFNETLVK